MATNELADTEYHTVSSRALGIANKLRELGVDSVLEVPTLVIAGDQSSGKSSVVEAIAGVALPRSDGTCTRCPTEVRMRATPSNAAPTTWTCRIKLRRDYDCDGLPLLEKPPEESFCTVDDKSHIAACVSAAQAVLLNPKAAEAVAGGVRAFAPDLTGTQPKMSPTAQALGNASQYELAFTANKVVLEIDGAEVDLTIVDLPGIIHDHPKGKHYVELVERMTKACLAPEHHIIAMALPAGLDPETQAIRLWVREVDPAGHRSIGIVTKPDTIPDDSYIANSKLAKLVRGGPSLENSHLRLGYYVVKNPTQEQLTEGIAFTAAREAEQRYFARANHWQAALAASPHLAERLGARNLRAGLSAQLVERIEAQLPAIRRTAREQLAALGRELPAMPPPPSEDALQELRGLLWRTAEAMERHVYATSLAGDKAFYQRTTALYHAYGEHAIRSTPAFLVGRTLISALSNADKGVLPPHGALGTAEGELDLTPYITGSGSEEEDEKEDENAYKVEGASGAEAAKVLGNNKKLQSDLAQLLFPQQHMTLEEVRTLHQRHLGDEMPTFSPYSAVKELIRRFKGQWSHHALKCLDDVAAVAHEQSAEVVTELFGRYPKALRVVSAAFSSYVEELTAEAVVQIRSLAKIEDADTFTLNDHYLRSQQSVFLGRLKRAHLKARVLNPTEEQQVHTMIQELEAYGVSFSSYEELFMAQTTDADGELKMMAACLAYFKVVFKRVQDGVPLLIRNVLLHRLGNKQGLEAAVMRCAGHRSGQQATAAAGEVGAAGRQVDMAEVARGIMAEDEAVAARRVQRRDMERRLREAMAVLHA